MTISMAYQKEKREELIDSLPCYCELANDGCTRQLYLTLAHRHNRWAYKKKPDMLCNRNQVIIACTKCHDRMDENKQYREEIFKDLRGEDEL